jgi:23S rRNA (cytidine1920-2'-O)/16S rRNA (cytidine1409-2'-O)-methyltransferase
VTKQRLDTAVVSRGLAETRTKAQRRIRAGDVRVNGQLVLSVSHKVSDDDVLTRDGGADYVGRGAHKLKAALEQWNLELEGCCVLDLGASTGGFTQVALDNGATRVIALDVGHGQLHPRLAADSRVESFEGINARLMDATWWQEQVGVSPQWVVADLSFVSLTQIIAPVRAAIGDAGWIVLVKPQFEVGRTKVQGGLVYDRDDHEAAVMSVLEHAATQGLSCHGVMASPITGEGGNQEYLCWLSPTLGRNPTQWSQQVHLLTHP